eukprot:c6793_g1_i1.p1 GENE.c6793_g1_i1~~c6793_g1_i1.p1  ORF type:complete len:624 (+),score=148.63 c6793_g1_i1:35-1873(+)
MGVIYRERGNYEKAVGCYLKALEIRPQCSQTLVNLAALFAQQGRTDEAHRFCAMAIAANPKYPESYNTLGVLYREEGDIDRAIAAYETCVAVERMAFSVAQNRLFALNCLSNVTHEFVFQEHRLWGEIFSKHVMEVAGNVVSITGYQRQLQDIVDGSRKQIRIGYISPDFFTHSVSFFIENLLKHHDRSRTFVICYSNVSTPDSRTNELKTLADLWKDVVGLPAAAVAKMVQEDSVDVLVELAGHTAGNRLDVMALSPAPVQVTWIGYPNTTGLAQIDYRITDAIVDPTDTQQSHTETLWRLPRVFLSYCPSVNVSGVSEAPCITNGFCTFGSFNSLSKITLRTRQTWARILSCLPHSRLVVKSKAFVSQCVRDNFIASFEKLGVDANRVDMMGLLPHTDHFAAYSLMDISLDTFPYAGTTTTCESLFMGVPCVTLAAPNNHCHCVGKTLLHAIGHAEWVCATEQEYIRVAVELGSNFTKIQKIRNTLRQEVLESQLCDGLGMARCADETFRAMCAEKLSSLTASPATSDGLDGSLSNLDIGVSKESITSTVTELVNQTVEDERNVLESFDDVSLSESSSVASVAGHKREGHHPNRLGALGPVKRHKESSND